MFKRIVPTFVALIASLALTACSAPPASDDGRLTIMVGLYPFQHIAQSVAGDHATVTNLTAPGAEPHDLELTPRQVADIGEADLVVHLAGLQPAVDEAVAQGNPTKALDVATTVTLLHSDSTEHDDEEEGEDEDAHESLTGLDPHVWLDTARMTVLASAIADALAGLDPDHAADYTANAAALAQEFSALDSEYATGLADCDRRTFVTSHAAFGYLAARYDLTQVPIAGVSPDAEPSPSRVAEVQRIARDAGVTTIFFETLVSPALAQTIAGDLGLKTAVLDPIEGLTDQSPAADYPGVMRANLAALKEANGCR